jgi:pyruvate/2-oxoglutarate dehydrogenase complex dihydrolipoamide acyltransferase (E2) component
MSNQGQGQVNVNTGSDNPNRNQNQALILGGIAVALLVIGLIFFIARPGSGGNTAGTPSPTNVPAGVTTLPGTGTTPDAGQATLPAPTEQAAPTEAAPTEPATTEAATTEPATTEPATTVPTTESTPESTPAEQPTTAVSPDAGPLDQQVAAVLQASPIGTGITDVRQNGPDILEIDFTIPQSASLPEAGAAARTQVRAILLALSVLPVDLGRVTLTGFYDLPGQPGATPVKLDYLSAVIKSTDWTTLPDEQLYQVADVQAIKDEFK